MVEISSNNSLKGTLTLNFSRIALEACNKKRESPPRSTIDAFASTSETFLPKSFASISVNAATIRCLRSDVCNPFTADDDIRIELLINDGYSQELPEIALLLNALAQQLQLPGHNFKLLKDQSARRGH